MSSSPQKGRIRLAAFRPLFQSSLRSPSVMSASSKAQPSRAAPPPTDRPVRLLLAGVWDLFHHGHANAMKSAKLLFSNTTLVVGSTLCG
jgi:hypothetical protein